jgi:hypothetical protein
MHDPMLVAFEIRRPWPRRSGRGEHACWYWPPLVTVWHVEPDGHDAGTVCPYRTHWRHPHHWRLQFPPLQALRRRLLTRCAWCGGRSTRRDVVNHSNSGWDGGRKSPWWRGELDLFHSDCASLERAHRSCTCPDPLLDHSGYGQCALCGGVRAYGRTEAQLKRIRLMATVPVGQRDPEVMARVRASVRSEQETEQ